MFLIAALILVIIFALYKVSVNKSPPKMGYTIYGTMGCGWTRKQLEYMEKSGKPFTFVDCDKGECAGMTAFPTTVDPSGKKTVGYKEF
tara:strand:+ start:97 stop:360 length:264 start_codon:yes stop_codon:yes gene_type:complete